jgi:hypothetical protein
MKVSIKQRTGVRKQRLFSCWVLQGASYQALVIVRNGNGNTFLSKDLSKRSMPLVYGRALNQELWVQARLRFAPLEPVPVSRARQSWRFLKVP